ncbi:DUF11 domain-containing protein [Colwellia sp. Arc7-D]|jgi:uncharacterized repeat protein (TIGR01451 family)|uniref:beta strand repeat-containing protein n=1 Tax=Colwellia sp. Arc7-D TaxID=2161872 RepID=UPI000D3A235B|nr:DUF11 domain-containing protein [Colwellia sp. Arc7-D]AWB59357.1 hypothetical protein DBO93_18485 [Colwellia sp. Arc7-D]|tara:strand:- start:23456 stop:26173 length:2718 start_codon:yes stop_codon:yes gene_type:complete
MRKYNYHNTFKRSALTTGILAAGASLCMSTTAMAAAPAAGAVVGNQATATYTDGTNETRTATSNLVETIVKQVAGVDIEADTSKLVAVGGTVYFPHTITNTGNGNDIYDLTDLDANTGTITFNSLEVYADADLDGIPDDFNPISVTPAMLAGEKYGIVVAAQVPSTVTSADVETLTIEAKSQFEPTILDFNTDTISVSDNAVIEVTKSMSVSSGPSPSLAAFDVVLTYTNSGNATATNVTLKDILPEGMMYANNSGSWSGATNGVLTDTDGANDDPLGIDYSYESVANPIAGEDIQVVIASVAPGSSGTVTFRVSIDSDLSPGDINNLASYEYYDGAAVLAPVNTNTATYTVLQSAAVVATDSEGTNSASNSDDDGSANDVVTEIDAANQGGTIKFSNIIMNNGNGIDTFELAVGNSTFPVGTSFQLYQADGLTPLTDTNGDGVPDTGPLDSDVTNVSTDDELEVVLVATLPIGASGNNNGLGYDVELTATSAVDPTQSDFVTDHLNEITASSVDLTNDAAFGDAGALGEGVGPETAAVSTNTIEPGEQTSFTLFVANTSAVADSYNLAFDEANDFTTPTLPEGWSIVFTDTSGNVITNTGVIRAGENLEITATVSTPDGQAPGTVDIYFRAQSSTSGAFDIKHDAVTTNTLRSVELNINGAGQVFPGGSQVYPHTLVNNGNVAETDGSLVATNTDSNSGWASIIYYDSNNNGVIDAGVDTVVDDINDFGGIAAGGSVPLLIKVISPAGADPGETNVSTLTATFSGGPTDSAEDITTVITGDVVLNKQQALDANCDGIVEGSFGPNVLAASPGECIAYQIIASNSGSESVTNLNINDSTPNFTSYEDCSDAAGSCPASVSSSGTGALNVTAPTNGSAGTVVATISTLNPTENASLTFTVQVNDNP